MNIVEWETSCELSSMLYHLHRNNKSSDRLYRLFAVACCLPLMPRLVSAQRDSLRHAEDCADRKRVVNKLMGEDSYFSHLNLAVYELLRPDSHSAAHHASYFSAMAQAENDKGIYQRVVRSQRVLLRRFFRPFEKPIILPYSADAVRMAVSAYEDRSRPCGRCGGVNELPGKILNWTPERRQHLVDCPHCRGTGLIDDGYLDPVRLMVLADALEDVSADGSVLTALRNDRPFMRGHWALEAVLNSRI